MLQEGRWRRYHVGVDAQKDRGARDADGGGEQEARFRAVDEVPQEGVDKGEGQGHL